MEENEKELQVVKRAVDICESTFENLCLPECWVTIFRYAPPLNKIFCKHVKECTHRSDIPEGQQLHTLVFTVGRFGALLLFWYT